VGHVEPALVGRDEERAVLARLVAEAAVGAGGVLVVEAPAGLGKSRLLAEAGVIADEHGLASRSTSADPLGGDVPLSLFSTLLDPAERPSPAVEGSQDPAEAQHLAREQAVVAIEEATAEQPLLLCLDDLQWADRPSLAVVSAVARRAERLPLALVLAARPDPRPAALAQLLDRLPPDTTRLTLESLAPTSVDALAQDLLGRPAGTNLRRHLAGAAGNPFLVVEALRALEQDDQIDHREDEAELTGGDATGRFLRDVLLDRLGSLGDGPLRLLETGAVLGRSFTLDEVAAVLGDDPTHLLPAARTALRSGLLERVDDDRLAFHHDLVREALYDEVPVVERDQLHRAAAESLADAGADDLRVGQHAAVGVRSGDHQSARWLLDAAASAATYDADSALGLLDRAAVAAEGDPDLQSEVAAARLTALAWSGRVAEAEAQAAAALGSRRDPREEALLEHRLGEALLVRGDSPAAVPHLQRALESGRLEGVDALRASAWLSAALMSSYDVPKALAAANAALAAIEAGPGDAEAEANALATRCRLRAWLLDLDDAVADAERALAIVRGGPVLRRPPHLLCGYTLANADRLDEADAVIREGIDHAERHGQISALPMLHSALVQLGAMTGDWDSATTEGALLLALCDETGVRAGRLEALALLAQIAHHQGDHDEVDALLARCDDEMATPGHDGGGISITLWAKAFRAEGAGDPGLGAQMLGDAFALAVGLDVRWAQVAYGPDLARMAVAAGDRATATYVADTVAPLGSRAGVHSAVAGVLACRGLADGSSDRLIEAAEHFGKAGHPFEQAQSHESAGDLLQARGRSAEAAEQLARAAALYRHLGAAHHLARVEDRPSARIDQPTARATSGWASLTPTELEIARLVGEGLTNAQIAERQASSRRTVETHVSRLYRKLEAPNRVVLAQQARDRA
jgi:DNA-binding CsgD family transcriptional regulator/tetratricopeptide (TPR) repeat protein